tara:strand:- start:351 stop:962 length:612 start_codon:yes stop_codon:yes gene_type:complete
MTTFQKSSNYNKDNGSLVIFNKFIEKVINDNNNYNKIKSKNYKKSLKIINIFTDNNEIINISSQKININLDIENTINSYLNNNNFLDNNFLKKIILFNFDINENNIKQFLSFDFNNFSLFYYFLSISFYVLNNKICINNKINITNKFNQINSNKLYFIDDLDCLYLLFEKKNNLKLLKNYDKLNKTKKNCNVSIKTKKNKIKK